jgi:hypothetical protein
MGLVSEEDEEAAAAAVFGATLRARPCHQWKKTAPGAEEGVDLKEPDGSPRSPSTSLQLLQRPTIRT